MQSKNGENLQLWGHLDPEANYPSSPLSAALSLRRSLGKTIIQKMKGLRNKEPKPATAAQVIVSNQFSPPFK